jgi:hypothetical protein
MKYRNVLLLGFLFVAACSSSTTATTAPDTGAGSDVSAGDTTAGDGAAQPAALTSLAKATTDGLEVELLSAKPLAVGYQRVFYRVKNAGAPVLKATIVQHPLMTMPDKSHGCPKTDPSGQADADGLFGADLIFQMASMGGTWAITVDVTPDGGAMKTVPLGTIDVGATTWATKIIVGTGMDAAKYVVSLYFPAAPKVGLNDYQVTVHKISADMMTFDPVADATIKGTPEMPSMGHGSTGNVDPAHTTGAFYIGKVNLSMPGDWRLTLEVTLAGAVIGSAVFNWDI